MRTYTPKADEIQRVWYEIDASGVVLGRLATEVARVLRGKHKPTFAPHMDTGDHVIVTNAAQFVMTAGKSDKKFHYNYSGYPGGMRSRSYTELMAKRPEEVVRIAVRGMLPKGPSGARCSASSRSTPAPSTTTPPRNPSHGHSTTRPTGSPEDWRGPLRDGANCNTPDEHHQRTTASQTAERRRRQVPKPLVQSTGRRKAAIARVRLRPGTGTITVNTRPVEDYFPSATHRMVLTEPLRVVDKATDYDIDATMDGGGISGQAGALRLGIARPFPNLSLSCASR